MPAPKLTGAQVLTIREDYARGGISQAELGLRFGVGQSCISSVLRGSGTSRHRERQELRGLGLKRCPKCGEVKSRDDGFYPHRTLGVSVYCRSCDKNTAVLAAQANPGRRDARYAAWRAKNPERVRTNGRKAASARRARIRDAFVEHVDPQVVFERDEGVCGICGELAERDCFDVDHVIPLALGGEHSYANSQVAHPPCNRAKGRAIALAAQAA
jgi:hypothetical protein